MSILERLGAGPIVQAGMGGGLSRHELAAAVSETGGLGTIAVNGAAAIRRELAAARSLTERPLAVNLLLPFARSDWFEAAAEADVVVTFWGRPRRRTPRTWIHQCGSVAEAREAYGAGADAAIVQGVEAGGHVRGAVRGPDGALSALELLERARAALPPDYPVLVAGGIATRDDARRAVEAGAAGAVAGTRFLLSEESHAHPDYRRRLLAADATLLTDLFGLGWPAPHRVVPNAATAHWLDRPASGPAELRSAPALSRAIDRASALGARYMPAALQRRLIAAQRPGGRLLTPQAATDDGPDTLVEAGPLYAGESVKRIADVRPAAEIVAALTP